MGIQYYHGKIINNINLEKILTINCSNDNINAKEEIRGELQMISRIIKAESLAGVHTHTHTHTNSLEKKLIKNINIRDNIIIFGNYNDTG